MVSCFFDGVRVSAGDVVMYGESNILDNTSSSYPFNVKSSILFLQKCQHFLSSENDVFFDLKWNFSRCCK